MLAFYKRVCFGLLKVPMVCPFSTKYAMAELPKSELTGRVVNTIDCHAPTGICFFSVWVFYDDGMPLVMDAVESVGSLLRLIA